MTPAVQDEALKLETSPFLPCPCHSPIPSSFIFIPRPGHHMPLLLAPHPAMEGHREPTGVMWCPFAPQRPPRALPIPASPRRFNFLSTGGLLSVRPLATPSSLVWSGSGQRWPRAQRGAGLQMAAHSGAGSPATAHAGLADPGLHLDFPKALQDPDVGLRHLLGCSRPPCFSHFSTGD